MRLTVPFLPGTGRGTAGTVVEGACPATQPCDRRIAPSVSPAGCHLPTSGEELR